MGHSRIVPSIIHQYAIDYDVNGFKPLQYWRSPKIYLHRLPAGKLEPDTLLGLIVLPVLALSQPIESAIKI
jgi:hypothetical protein